MGRSDEGISESSLQKVLIRSWLFLSMQDGFITWRGETNKLFLNGEDSDTSAFRVYARIWRVACIRQAEMEAYFPGLVG
jgi:hypothetical protein